MTIRGLAACLFITCGLWACTQTPTEPPTEPASLTTDVDVDADEVTIAPIEAVIAPTPTMLKAALSGDPDAMRDAVGTLNGCHASTTCPGYDACTGWSSTSFCNATCGPTSCPCKPWIDPDCIPGDLLRGRDYYESYRVCFNAAGQSCTEWKQTISAWCGC